jgi:hypothetical protein
VAPGEDDRSGGRLRDLVLMDVNKAETAFREKRAALRSLKFHGLDSQSPALVRLANDPSQGLADDLMAETDPRERKAFPMGPADPVLKGRYPGQIVIGPGAAAGDKINCSVLADIFIFRPSVPNRGQNTPVDWENLVFMYLRPRCIEKPPEHEGVGGDVRREYAAEVVAEKNSYRHRWLILYPLRKMDKGQGARI